jgi:hypothetical protein
MINPVTETYYKDISRPPKAGEEFIELAWADIPGFELTVTRGIFDDKRKQKTKTLQFPTSKELDEAIGAYRHAALRKGFKRYSQSEYVLLEGKPLR